MTSGAPVLAPRTPVEMFAIRLADDPDAALLLTADGDVRSYRQIGARADRLADQLRARGAMPGDVVGLYLGNEPNWVVSALASWWCGCAIAACGTVSPRHEAERRFRLVAPRLVVAAESVGLSDEWPVLKVSSEGEQIAPVSEHVDAEGGVAAWRVAPDPSSNAAIIFTSGTSGEPKATVHSHERLLSNAQATASAYAKHAGFRPRTAPPDRAPSVSFSPFGHLAAISRLMFRVYVGRSLLIVPRFDVTVLEEIAQRYPLDNLQLIPAMLHTLAFTDEVVELGSLKYVTSGTAPLSIATRDAFERRYGVHVLQAYGSSEGCVTARERNEDVRAGRRGPGSVGRVDGPVRIVDPGGKDVAVGEDGEIIGLPDLSASGRYLSAEGGVESLPLDDDGWYHTGDLGYLDEHGILYVTGRLKEMLVVGGFNVFPAEIEDALRTSDLVRDAVVVSVPDERLGEIPVAGIVWTPGAELDRETQAHELATEIRLRVAPYKVPRQWFTLEKVPLNANGKVDRMRVRNLALESMEVRSDS
jgi:acyl-CoA synthetase (AMP-forming)/AMP-acid ligase II